MIWLLIGAWCAAAAGLAVLIGKGIKLADDHRPWF
jgi:hypothetical protein